MKIKLLCKAVSGIHAQPETHYQQSFSKSRWAFKARCTTRAVPSPGLSLRAQTRVSASLRAVTLTTKQQKKPQNPTNHQKTSRNGRITARKREKTPTFSTGGLRLAAYRAGPSLRVCAPHTLPEENGVGAGSAAAQRVSPRRAWRLLRVRRGSDTIPKKRGRGTEKKNQKKTPTKTQTQQKRKSLKNNPRLPVSSPSGAAVPLRAAA